MTSLLDAIREGENGTGKDSRFPHAPPDWKHELALTAARQGRPQGSLSPLPGRAGGAGLPDRRPQGAAGRRRPGFRQRGLGLTRVRIVCVAFRVFSIAA